MQEAAAPSTTDPRRSRVRRGELSRERVLVAALELLEREGEGALSMRRVAAELGTAPMSLYRHVHDKADLIDGVVALALGALSSPPSAAEDWAARARDWMTALRRELERHPVIVPLLRSHHMMLPAVLGRLEVLLRDLRESGFDRARAAQAAWEMLWFTMSFAVSEQRLTSSGLPATVGGIAPAESHAEAFPHVARALPELLAMSRGDLFEPGARHLVEGLRAELAIVGEG